ETGNQKWILVCRPVFGGNDTRRLRGFALATLSMETMLKSGIMDNAVLMELSLLHKDAGPELLATTGDAGATTVAGLSATRPVLAFGKTFRLTAHAMPAFMQMHPVRAGILAVLIGLALTAALAVVIRLTSLQREGLEHLVVERTNELSQSEAQVRLLLNSVGGAIYGIDLQGSCTFANPACAKILGYPDQHALLGRNMHLLIHHSHPNGKPMPACKIYRAFHDNRDLHVGDEVFWKADGTSFPAEYWSSPQVVDGKVCGAVVVFTDISERKRREEELRLMTDRLTLAARAGGVGIWDLDVPNNRLVWDSQMFQLYGHRLIWDRHTFQIHGLTPDQFSAAYDAWRNGVHPEDRQRIDDEMQLALRGTKDFDTEFRIVHPNGSIHNIRALALVQRDDFGEPLRMIGTNWDITTHKQALQALRESEANFHTFFESLTDMIFVGTPAGRILFTNIAVTRTLGYSAEELSTMHMMDMHPADKRREAEAIFAAMFRGERETCSLPLATKDGALVPVETRVWSGRWNGADCIFGISKDLSIEREAQQRFECLFRNNPALMALSSLPERRITDVNNAFMKALGYSKDEVIGKTPAELGLFPNPEQQEAASRELLPGGHLVDSEMTVRCKNGSTLDGIFSGEIIASQGKQYLLTVMVDISERKRIQEALISSNEALNRRNAELHDLYHTVSHELKTPLTSAREFASIMLDGIAGPLTDDQKLYLQLIRESCDQLHFCVSDLLEATQLETGKMILRSVETPIEALVATIMNAMAPSMQAKGIVFRHEVDPSIGSASLDERRITQVCTNLLSNALKFTPEGGTITVRVDNDSDNPMLIRFSVSDTGCGIAPEHLDRIFDRFYQVKKSDTSIVGGVGLGLYIANSIVRLHGGRMWVESTVNKGTTFFFTVLRRIPPSG
ncbi:MAG: PAS domain S-box protein, partial [bacterium]